MNDEALNKRRDGKYEERLSESWIAEYSENLDTGLWEVEIFKSDVAEWYSLDYVSLDDARKAAYNFYDQA